MADKVKEIETLLGKLEIDIAKEDLSAEERLSFLSRLKVLGRDPQGSDQLFHERGIRTLASYGFDRSDGEASREALRCLANALLLQQETRKILTKLDYGGKATELLANQDIADEFLASRILLILTYNPDFDVEILVRKHSLATNVNDCLARHAFVLSSDDENATKEAESRAPALSETLKLLYNLYHMHPSLSSHFNDSFPLLLTLLLNHTLFNTPPLSPPTSNLINALMNYDLDTPPHPAILFPPATPTLHAATLLTLLSAATAALSPSALETAATPLLTLLRRVHAAAPPPARAYLRTALLPSPADRAQPLGRTPTLPSRLLALTAAPAARTLADSILALLFEACDADPAALVRNIGYGYASGFLVNRGLGVPREEAEAVAVAEGEGEGGETNFVTGQFLSEEEVPEVGEEMTEEEKMREAERLFVLFERLRATGVVDVRNPVAAAVEEGRFEEVE